MVWKMKRLAEDDKAVASLFDAVMFFMVMLIAATVISVFSNQAFQTADVVGREEMIRYTEETRTAILRSTIYDTWYEDNEGNESHLYNMTVNELLLYELVLLNDDKLNTDHPPAMEKDIENVTNRLVKSGYGYALQARYGSHEIFISYEDISSEDEIPQGLMITSLWSSPMINGKDGDAEITLSIWRE
ncbi:MAG: hypothetical protein JSV09_13290 [Thermoplasmata archaeon]|nr:MAG: hypothetical protein JSV09_13290 [Thermoplasmata archaeon]